MRAFIVDHVRIAKRVSDIFGDKHVIDTHIRFGGLCKSGGISRYVSFTVPAECSKTSPASRARTARSWACR